VLALLVGLSLCGSPSVSADLQTRAGYDSNVFFGSVHDVADPVEQGLGVESDGFVALHGRLVGALEPGRLRLRAQDDLAYTQYGSVAHGYAVVNRLGLSQEVRLGRVTIGLLESADAYVISAFRSDRLLRAWGGLNGGLSAGPVDLAARLEGGQRHFPYREVTLGVPEDDRFGAGALSARTLLGPLALDLVARAELRRSNAGSLSGDLETVEVGVAFWRSVLATDLHAEGRRLGLPSFAVSDAEVGRQDLQLALRARVERRFGVVVPSIEVAWERATSNYGLARFTRVVAEVGIGLAWDPQPARPHSLAPTPSTPGRYHLEVVLHGAHAVRVIGGFQGWRPPGILLAPLGGDRHAVDLDLPAGRHRYQLVVDGERVMPPDADAYEPDGLGGVDGVIIVPSASTGGDVR
jgi:hypothetical protein